MEPVQAIPEAAIRLGAFAGIFAVVALWEMISPCRDAAVPKRHRWPNNLAIAGLNVLVLRAAVPLAAVGTAAAAATHGWGLFNVVTAGPVAAFLVTVIALDFAIWLQHRLFHAVPVLWRLHRVHHADMDFDVTTGLRFHPFEMLLSILIKMGCIVLMGAPIIAVIAFEVILNATSLFNHANARLPRRIEPYVRALIVTPDMHRVHHSVLDDEMNSNFGFNLSLWDRLFGTYRADPRSEHVSMTIGLSQWRGAQRVVGLASMLLMPFRTEGSIDSADPESGRSA